MYQVKGWTKHFCPIWSGGPLQRALESHRGLCRLLAEEYRLCRRGRLIQSFFSKPLRWKKPLHRPLAGGIFALYTYVLLLLLLSSYLSLLSYHIYIIKRLRTENQSPHTGHLSAQFVSEGHLIPSKAVPDSSAGWTGSMQPYLQLTKLSNSHGLNQLERTLSFDVKTSDKNSRKKQGLGS